MSISRLIIGGIVSLFGLWLLLFVGFIDGPEIDFSGIISGGVFLVLGIFILLNKKEDEIEGRKDLNKRKSKKENE